MLRLCEEQPNATPVNSCVLRILHKTDHVLFEDKPDSVFLNGLLQVEGYGYDYVFAGFKILFLNVMLEPDYLITLK